MSYALKDVSKHLEKVAEELQEAVRDANSIDI